MEQFEPQSQCGQDLWVLSQLNYKRNGFFVDVGASHYKKLSNTYYLEKEYGWTGICIEGNPEFFQTLVDNRACACVNRYVSDNTNPTFVNKATHTPGDDLDKGFGDFLEISNITTPTTHKVEVVPTLLMDILQENNIPPVVDYLSIDIEGADFPVLQTIDFDKYTFRTVTIENNTPKFTNEIINLMWKHNYVYAGILTIDLTFIFRG
jgi:FkbM family methyltransferase